MNRMESGDNMFDGFAEDCPEISQRYTLKKVLGKGTYGSVVKAFDNKT